MEPLINLSQRVTLAPLAGIRFSNILEMREDEVARLISILENDPIFLKFYRTKDPEKKIFFRQRFPNTHLATSFYEFKEELSLEPASAALEEVLLEHKELLKEIEKIGRENFEKYFLYDDGTKTSGEIAQELGIPETTAREIMQLTEKVLIQQEFLPASGSLGKDVHQELALPITKIAAYELGSKGKYELHFFSPLIARGVLQIHYEHLKKLKKSKVISDEEKRKLRQIVKWIELINARKKLIYRLLKILPELQKEFFLNAEENQLTTLTQREVANKLNITPSTISRAIARRSVVLPQGREILLTDFFLSRKKWLKKKLVSIFEEKKELSDREIQELVRKEFGISLSRRSINVYRQEMKKDRI